MTSAATEKDIDSTIKRWLYLGIVAGERGRRERSVRRVHRADRKLRKGLHEFIGHRAGFWDWGKLWTGLMD